MLNIFSTFQQGLTLFQSLSGLVCEKDNLFSKISTSFSTQETCFLILWSLKLGHYKTQNFFQTLNSLSLHLIQRKLQLKWIQFDLFSIGLTLIVSI
jgi:hypothetical protein